ncbi:MAG: type I-B CRISPR-associated endonuclease Cas1b [bacterium]
MCFESSQGKKFVPVASVSSLYIFGEVSLNKKLLEFVSENHITLHFFNYYGFYIGSYIPRAHYSSGFIILKQVEHYLDKIKRLELAKKFVYGGAMNMIKVLKYYESENLSALIRTLNQLIKLIDSSDNIESLMALEANIRENYYSGFNHIINVDDMKFYGRERRPPKGPLNALISFGNGLLYATVLGEIYKTHLDPRIGYLHSTNFRKFSLNLDVAEVFKPIITDRVIFTLINRGEINLSDFNKELGGTYLIEKGRIKFLKEFNDRLNQTITLERRKLSYQTLIRTELYKIEKHIMQEKEYFPYISQW